MTAPASFPSYFRSRSPFRRSFEGWVLATMTATAAVFSVANLAFLLGFSTPPINSEVVVLMLSVASGSLLTVLGALAIWVLAVPVCWAVWRCAWGVRLMVARRSVAAARLARL